MTSLMINWKITNEINRSRVEIIFVRGFNSFNIFEMSLFTTTFCRSTHMMIMKMASKWNVIVICMVESENNH